MMRRNTKWHSRARRRHSRGSVLLEAMVALAILATSGLSIVRLAAESGRTLAHARESELETRKASRLLDAVALWTHEDLDRHLGDRREGPWRMQIQRVTTALYSVSITDSTETRAILQTTLFKPLRGGDADVSR